MSRYIPQAYKKARKEVCKKKNETKKQNYMKNFINQ